jgi:ABC-type antimicrobial peptide transport system permease subunit
MKVPLAWRILTYDKRRTALALIGIFMAILLVFVELGFFYAVPRGGLPLTSRGFSRAASASGSRSAARQRRGRKRMSRLSR